MIFLEEWEKSCFLFPLKGIILISTNCQQVSPDTPTEIPATDTDPAENLPCEKEVIYLLWDLPHGILVHRARQRLSKNLLLCSAQPPHRDTKRAKCNFPRAAPEQLLTQHRYRLLGKGALLPHSSSSADGATQSAQGTDLDENLTQLFPDLPACRNASASPTRRTKVCPHRQSFCRGPQTCQLRMMV